MRAGEGVPEAPPASTRAPVGTDHRLLGRLIDGIARVFKEMGQAAPLHQIGERAALYHDRIVAETDDPDDRIMRAGELLAELRSELRAAASQPQTAKRSA